MAMDYDQAALKLLCVQLKDAVDSPPDNAVNLRGILFQRAWLQGVLVSASADGDFLLLDDGTALIQLYLPSSFPRRRSWTVGMYVMAIGRYIVGTTESPMIQIHKMVDLSDSPDREAMWYLEVLEAFELFYKPLMAEEMPHD